MDATTLPTVWGRPTEVSLGASGAGITRCAGCAANGRSYSSRFAPDFDPVHLLRVETQIAGNAWAVRQRIEIGPGHVLHAAVADPQRPVGGGALVRADGAAGRASQKLLPHVLLRDVVARRTTGLEQEHAAPCVRDGLAIEGDLHPSRARPHIDPGIRVARVAEDLLILLDPMVDLVPIEGEVILDLRHLRQRLLIA